MYRHSGLVESKEGSPNCHGVRILFVPTEIGVDGNPLLD